MNMIGFVARAGSMRPLCCKGCASLHARLTDQLNMNRITQKGALNDNAMSSSDPFIRTIENSILYSLLVFGT